jgi:hypothetical protein
MSDDYPIVRLSLSNIQPTARPNDARKYYTSLERIKEFAAGWGLDTFACESKINALLPTANSYIDMYTQTNFRLNTNEVEFRDGAGTDTLILYHHPIVRINQLVLYNQLLQTMRVFLDTELIIDAPYGLVKLPPIYPAFLSDSPSRAIFGNIFIKGSRNIEIDYDWGFSETPSDIQLAATKYIMIQLMQGKDAQNNQGLKSISFDGMSESYGGYTDMIKDFKDEIKMILDNYKNYSGMMRSI